MQLNKTTYICPANGNAYIELEGSVPFSSKTKEFGDYDLSSECRSCDFCQECLQFSIHGNKNEMIEHK
jgi:hypothetical protein